MLNPYVKKEDILKLIENLTINSEYINRNELQRAISSSKEYKKPKEIKIYRPYNIIGNENSINITIRRYRDYIEKNALSNEMYIFALELGLTPPFLVEYNIGDKTINIPITDIVCKLETVGEILNISKGTYSRYKKEGYIQCFNKLTLIHGNGKSIIPIKHYNISDIAYNLLNSESITY